MGFGEGGAEGGGREGSGCQVIGGKVSEEVVVDVDVGFVVYCDVWVLVFAVG